VANDTSLAVRRAIITALRAYGPLTALVPAGRIYPPQMPATPVWPFVRYGTATVIPDRATGMDGARIIVSVHAFARGPGEDAASAIAKAIATCLDEANLTTEDGDQLTIFWTGGQTLQDPEEANSWHCTSDFEITVASPD